MAGGDDGTYYNGESVQDSTNLKSDYYTQSLEGAPPEGTGLDIIQNLQDSFDLSHMDLNKLTSEERQAEIKRCKHMNMHYRRMMYFISSNSGYFQYSANVNYFFISEHLKLPSADNTRLNVKQGIAWSIKPLYGWICDSFYPFKYRIKPYIFLACCLNILICVTIFLVEPSFELFLIQWLVMNIGVAFIDAMAEGITAINTKIDTKIAKL
jgi:hypothetical protein